MIIIGDTPEQLGSATTANALIIDGKVFTKEQVIALKAERDALLVYAIDAEKWFNKHDPHGYVSPKRADAQAALAAHDTEVAAKAVLDYNLHLRKDLDDKLPVRCIGIHGDEYAAQLRAKAKP